MSITQTRGHPNDVACRVHDLDKKTSKDMSDTLALEKTWGRRGGGAIKEMARWVKRKGEPTKRGGGGGNLKLKGK